MMNKVKVELRPGDHVRTPFGLGWVNVHPTGEFRIDQVFVRCDDNSTQWIAVKDAALVK
jgi:hypothetical protein